MSHGVDMDVRANAYKVPQKCVPGHIKKKKNKEERAMLLAVSVAAGIQQ